MVLSICLLFVLHKLLDTRVSLLVDTVGSGVPVDVGQPRFFDQHRQVVVDQAARPADHYVQSEARGG